MKTIRIYKRIFSVMAGITVTLIVFSSSVIGQELTAAERSRMCSDKQSALNRLLADAEPRRAKINQHISDAEQLARFARQHRERLFTIPANQARDELNQGLNSANSQIRLLQNDAANAPAQRYRDKAKAELERLYPYRDFLAHLLASIESGGLIPAGRPEDDQFVRDLDRNVRRLRDESDQIGSDINILRQNMASLGCDESKPTGNSGGMDGETSSGRGTIEEEGGTAQSPATGNVTPTTAELPAAFKNKTVVRTEQLEAVLECWSASANAPCTAPNLESFATIYYFSDGSNFWDRRDYDNKRKQMADAGMVFRWACGKSLWRNGRCG